LGYRFFFIILFSKTFEESTMSLASQSCGGATRTIAPSMPSHACPGRAAGGPRRGLLPCRRRQRYKHGSVVERPQKCYGKELELVEGIQPRGLTYHCTEKAGYISSAPLHNCRVVLFLLRQRNGACHGELQRERGRNTFFATAPSHT
jgi:hypothetical protein